LQAAIKYCAVQHYVLCVFKKVLEGTSYYIELFSVRVGVWEVVFCEYYYFGLAGLEIPAYKEAKNLQRTYKGRPGLQRPGCCPRRGGHIPLAHLKKVPDLCVTLQIPDFKDAEPLRVGVISFVDFATGHWNWRC
jgi:hypothetical protein